MPVIPIYRQRLAIRNRDTLDVERSERFSFEPILDETFTVDSFYNVRTGRTRGHGVFRRPVWESRPVQFLHHYTRGTEPIFVKVPIDAELLTSPQPDGTTHKVLRWKRSPVFSTWDTKWRFVFLNARDLFRLATDGTPNEVGERLFIVPDPNAKETTDAGSELRKAACGGHVQGTGELGRNHRDDMARATHGREGVSSPTPGEGVDSIAVEDGETDSQVPKVDKRPASPAWNPSSGVVEVGGARIGFGPGVKRWHVHGPHQIDVSDGARWISFRLADLELIRDIEGVDVRLVEAEQQRPEPEPIRAPEIVTRGPYAAEIVTPHATRRAADLPGQLMMF